jgi:hypothetical protein
MSANVTVLVKKIRFLEFTVTLDEWTQMQPTGCAFIVLKTIISIGMRCGQIIGHQGFSVV